ncbi:epoxide hydrolase [Coprinopsis cinerea okayama7|uniref:Epoxide hydrolase n=1 Tax=Coprinopsis cinerea (strain Okayama-7 / 130 / ATCC MYA-4618 / FGSC 9003) TaxID=240176 RepID=A8P0E1_COPC7|nr:epoxide hydrolase [Coprinopsis cinerea okayama7\|eukprot:XP_001837869.2 epoxide hydrolase [Coprinopsis cinerea okayama7\
MASTETPFTIAIPDSEIDLLRKKLESTRFPDELEEAERDYGVPLADLRRLVEHWRGGYDWRPHEAQLNQEFPQFTRDIEVEGHGTLNIHYVHKKSEVADAIPLLFVHGWPGSVIEVRKILPLLLQVSPDHPSFHVVTYSLPGYGFSEAPKKKGFADAQMAEVGHKLMLALGYNEYVTQGGDWGAMICRTMAQLYGPKHVKAWHTNMPFAYPPHPIHRPQLWLKHVLFKYNARDQARLERTKWFSDRGSGYLHEQATQPQTLGYSLADSPAGLLAWIYEKLYMWTDDYKWTDDERPAASVRIYYEYVKIHGLPSEWTKNLETVVPTGYSYFPKELIGFPKSWNTAGFPNVIFEGDHDSGGHFAAYEVPEMLVGDLRKMFGKDGPAFGVVPGKTGYA